MHSDYTIFLLQSPPLLSFDIFLVIFTSFSFISLPEEIDVDR